jgi:hypothetical protein
MNRLRLSDSLDLIKYTFALLLVLVGVVAVVAFVIAFAHLASSYIKTK